MGNPRIIINPSCNCGYYDKYNMICVSLYRGPRSGVFFGHRVSVPAKSVQICYQGGAQQYGEEIAKEVIRQIKEKSGIEGKIVPPNSNPDSRTSEGGPEYAPSGSGRAKTAIIEFPDIDVYDHYFTTTDYAGRASDGGSGFVQPVKDKDGGIGWGPAKGRTDPPEGWTPPVEWGNPRGEPIAPSNPHDPPRAGPVPGGRPAPALPRELPEVPREPPPEPAHASRTSSFPPGVGMTGARQTPELQGYLQLWRPSWSGMGLLTLEFAIGTRHGISVATLFLELEGGPFRRNHFLAISSWLARMGLESSVTDHAILFSLAGHSATWNVRFESSIGASGLYLISGVLPDPWRSAAQPATEQLVRPASQSGGPQLAPADKASGCGHSTGPCSCRTCIGNEAYAALEPLVRHITQGMSKVETLTSSLRPYVMAGQPVAPGRGLEAMHDR